MDNELYIRIIISTTDTDSVANPLSKSTSIVQKDAKGEKYCHSNYCSLHNINTITRKCFFYSRKAVKLL